VGHLDKAVCQTSRSSGNARRRVLVARAKSWLKWRRLPPGNFFRLETLLASDPKALALKAEKTGPILTGVWGDKIAICITSLPVARRLLQQHKNNLNAISADIRPVVPKGILRTMEGEDHRTYRKVFSKAISASDFASQTADVRAIVAEALIEVVDGKPDAALCDRIALRMLIRTFIGIDRRSALHQDLEDQFFAMAPNGFAWRVGPQQKVAFDIIHARLAALASRPAGESDVLPDSVLFRLLQEGATDLTTLGNLIYMIEMGRVDISTFLFRVVNFMGDDPSLFRRIAQDEKSASGVSITQAIAFEALRVEQSERLMRSAKRDFVFDNYLFPRGAIVRICLWEAHKNSGAFVDPFSFDANRYLDNSFSGDEFCPFGMGHHQCPAADSSVQLASRFIEVYAKSRLLEDALMPAAELDAGRKQEHLA